MRPAGNFGVGRADPERPLSDAHLFRFTVKADRQLNTAIGRLAKARGVEPGIFVQQHFEKILDVSRAGSSAAPLPEREPSLDDDREMAVSLGITPLAVRVHRAMVRRADSQGNICIALADLALAIGHKGVNGGSIANALKQLQEKQLIRKVDAGSRRKPTTWHIYSVEGRPS